jgi:Holliday junction DNA helicase RuvB
MNRQESFAGRLDREYQKPISCPRPASLKEFVGQEHAKRLITTSAASAKRRNAPFPHTLITGFAGGGKTTLACLIARYMDVSFVPVTADAIADTAAVGELMASLDDTGYDREGNPSGTIRPTVLFLDEAHRLPRQSQELLYACIEDRVLNVRTRDPLTGVTRSVRQWVPFFSLVAATNRPGSLTPSFRDRLRLHLRLLPYAPEESVQIARGTMARMAIECGPKAAWMIAQRSRNVPRQIVSLCERIRDFAVAKGRLRVSPAVCMQAFEALEIDELGLTRQDVDLLAYLAQCSGEPVGLSTLASVLQEQEQAVEENVEPYLLRCGLIARTARGRTITEPGLRHLREAHSLPIEGGAPQP